MYDPVLSVVIPVYNERDHIQSVLDTVNAVPIDKEIIVIDDGSTDGTRDLIVNTILPNNRHIRYFEHSENMGKGAAIQTGISKATSPLTIIQDADMEYDPNDYKALIQKFSDSNVMVVYGSRFLSGKRVTHPLHYAVNQFITQLGNLLFGVKLTDLETCYKMARTEVFKALPLKSQGFEIEVELTVRFLQSGHKIHEVPVSYKGRGYHQGKKITWKDGIVAVLDLIKYRFKN